LRTGKAAFGSRAFFWHLPHYTKQGSRPAGAMRDGRWKLVEHYDTGEVELFDLDTDVGERVDRSNTDATRTASLRQQLRDWRIAVGGQENTPNPLPTPHSSTSSTSSSTRPASIRSAQTAARGELWRSGANE